jgi:hypothetical protein
MIRKCDIGGCKMQQVHSLCTLHKEHARERKKRIKAKKRPKGLENHDLLASDEARQSLQDDQKGVVSMQCERKN